VSRVLRVAAVAIVLYVGLIGLTGSASASAAGFVPTQDKEYLVAFAQLPDGATLDRTDAVIRKMTDIALKHPACSAPWRSRAVDQRLRQRAEHRHRVRRPEAVGGADDAD
jgi:multidrug efflux pump subunit AcrB